MWKDLPCFTSLQPIPIGFLPEHLRYRLNFGELLQEVLQKLPTYENSIVQLISVEGVGQSCGCYKFLQPIPATNFVLHFKVLYAAKKYYQFRFKTANLAEDTIYSIGLNLDFDTVTSLKAIEAIYSVIGAHCRSLRNHKNIKQPTLLHEYKRYLHSNSLFHVCNCPVNLWAYNLNIWNKYPHILPPLDETQYQFYRVYIHPRLQNINSRSLLREPKL